jgi:hypothetical protein
MKNTSPSIRFLVGKLVFSKVMLNKFYRLYILIKLYAYLVYKRLYEYIHISNIFLYDISSVAIDVSIIFVRKIDG